MVILEEYMGYTEVGGSAFGPVRVLVYDLRRGEERRAAEKGG
jgi:hypothetical protein